MATSSRGKRVRRESNPSVEEEDVAQAPAGRRQPMTHAEKKAMIRKWKVAYERGFDFNDLERSRNFRPTIDRLFWNEFAQHPVNPCITLVHEFYANLPLSSNQDEVKVFGRIVNISERNINRVLQIRQLDSIDWFSRFLEMRPEDSEIRHTLTLGSLGDVIERTGALTIGSLSEEARWWRKFMSGRILGTTRESETTYEQQILLFCIVLGRRFNVGKLIHAKLMKMREKIRIGSMAKLVLSFPSLITMLCHEVRRPPNSIEINNMHPFSDHTMPSTGQHDQSIYDFHRQHWEGQGNPDWQPPMIGAAQPPSPRQEEEQPYQGAGSSSSSSHFSFDQDGWYSYQDVQAQRHRELVCGMETISLRVNDMNNRLGSMEQRQDAFYRRADAYFQGQQHVSDSEQDSDSADF